MQGFYEKLLCKYHHYLQKDPEDLAVISQFTDSFMPPFTTPQVLKPKGKIEQQPSQMRETMNNTVERRPNQITNVQDNVVKTMEQCVGQLTTARQLSLPT